MSPASTITAVSEVPSWLGETTTLVSSSIPYLRDVHCSKAFPLLLSCQAVYVRPRSCHRSSWLSPEYLDAYFSASRFYSQTSSFTKIILEPKQLPCDQEKMFSVLYSLNPEAYKEASDVTFFYLVSFSRWLCLISTVQLRRCHLSDLANLSELHLLTSLASTPGTVKNTGTSLQSGPRRSEFPSDGDTRFFNHSVVLDIECLRPGVFRVK
jgi:hypothetical protein